MIKFKKIETDQEPMLKSYYDLYKRSFPPEERRDKKDFELLLGKEKRFSPCLVLDNGNFIGFLNYWILDDFCFVEHFAIRIDIRGKQYGTKVMEKFMKTIGDLPLIFEVEKPETTDAKRRITFYERFGMQTLQQDYAQPLYGDPNRLLPLLLMSNNISFANENFDRIKTSLHRDIYHI